MLNQLTNDRRPPVRKWDDERLDQLIGRVLQTGVILAAAITAASGVLYLMRHGAEPVQYAVFHGEPAAFREVSGIIDAARRFSARGLIQIGVLVLIATPIARVALAALGFLAERDYLYTTIATIVLLLLLIGSIGVGL